MTEDAEAALIGAQFKHSVDLLRMKISALEAKHDSEISALQAVSNAKAELYEFKIAALEAKRVEDLKRLECLESKADGFEALASNIRLIGSLSTGGGLMGLVALVKSLIGL